MFRQDFTCPALLENINYITRTGLSPFYGPTFQMVPLISLILLAWSAFARHY
jgi:hypothetical protein